MAFNIPTEVVELPSKGLVYPADSPLSSGKIEMKYMTAKEEDILTNQNYLRQGIAIDKLLQSMIVSPINYNDLLIGDRDALMLAARILSYGKEYSFAYKGKEHKVDLTSYQSKVINEKEYSAGVNEFTFTLPDTGNVITFKLLSHGDEGKIDTEIKGLQKVNQESSTQVTTRLKYTITSINGSREVKDIRDFIDNAFLAKEARAFREYYSSLLPGIDYTTRLVINGVEEDVDLPIGLSFFWPDA
jgi:hypothetical protein